jgi:hypothetical protein
MKSITITQPWATLIVLGAKHYETRTWETRHRGQLAIHASRRFPEAQRELCRHEPIRSVLRKAGYYSWSDLPIGAVLGTVQLTDCLPVEKVLALDPAERVLGDYHPGRWAWVLTGARELPAPVPCRGMLGIYEVPAECVGRIMESSY